MDPIVETAGTALVAAIATDAWQRVSDGMVALWRRFRPAQAETLAIDLDDLRQCVLEAREGGDAQAETQLAGEWRRRFQCLLREDAAFADELRRMVDEVLVPAVPPAEQSRIGAVTMTATAGDHGRVYQAGGNMHIAGG